MPHLEYMREAGAEGIEMVMWLDHARRARRQGERGLPLLHVPASNTAVGHIILENRTRTAGAVGTRACAGEGGRQARKRAAPREAKTRL